MSQVAAGASAILLPTSPSGTGIAEVVVANGKNADLTEQWMNRSRQVVLKVHRAVESKVVVVVL
jgi:hypothetical protein